MKNRDEENRFSEENTSGAAMRRTVFIFALCITAIILLSRIDAIKSAVGWLFGILSPILIGVVLAYIINPVYVWVEKLFLKAFAKCKRMSNKWRLRLSHGLGVALSVSFMLAVIALLLFLIIPELLESLEKLIKLTPSIIDNASEWLNAQKDSDNIFMLNLSDIVAQALASISDWLKNKAADALGSVISSVYSVVMFIFDFLIAILVCIYALLEKKQFIAQSKKMLFALYNPEKANYILSAARYGNHIFGRIVSGKILTSAMIGVATYIFMLIMKMPYALLSSAVVAVTNVIPFFGPFIGGIPTCFIIMLNDVRQGIIYGVFCIVIQQIEGNVISPKIAEEKTGVSQFWVTFALISCGGIFGLMGMLFSVPALAVLFYCIRIAVERRLREKGLPIPSAEYLNVDAYDTETESFVLHPDSEQLPAEKAPEENAPGSGYGTDKTE